MGLSRETAREAGFLDQLVRPGELQAQAHAKAAALMELDIYAHTATKRRMRAEALTNIRKGLRADMRDAVVMGLRQLGRSK